MKREGPYFLVSGVRKGLNPENLWHTWPWVFGPWIFYLHPCLALYHRLILVPDSQVQMTGKEPNFFFSVGYRYLLGE